MCADDFRGDELLPLNLLATRFPDVHDREIRKWDGRESVVDFVVPHLGVTWGDTVNLAALDPARLVEARRRLGVPFSGLQQRRVLRFPSIASPVSRPSSTTADRTGGTADPISWTCRAPHRTRTSHPSTLPPTRSSPRYPRCTSTISSSNEAPALQHSASCSSATSLSREPSTSLGSSERG